MELYLWPFLLALSGSFLLHKVLLCGAHQYSFLRGLVARSARHEQTRAVTRLGGAAIAAAFLLVVIADVHLIINERLAIILYGALALFIFGVIDDVKKVPWSLQLSGQILVISAVFFAGVQIDVISLPFVGVVDFGGGTIVAFGATLLWFLLVINAFNWSDGIDGVSGGVGVIAAVTILCVALLPEVNQPPVGIVAVILAGALGGFLFFNFSPAKIFAGTSGAFFVGFMIAALAIFAGAKIATTLLVLAIPVVDALWVICERLRTGQSIFRADRNHLHHKLLTLGLSHRAIALLYYAITITIAVLALQTKFLGKLYVIVGVFIVLSLFVIFVSHYAKQYVEKR